MNKLRLKWTHEEARQFLKELDQIPTISSSLIPLIDEAFTIKKKSTDDLQAAVKKEVK